MLHTYNTPFTGAVHLDAVAQQPADIDALAIDKQALILHASSKMPQTKFSDKHCDDLVVAHQRLVNAAGDLVEELETDHIAHSDIYAIAVKYLETVDCDLQAVPVATLRKNGKRFTAIVQAAKSDIANGDLPPLAEEQGEAVSSLMDLHDLFMRLVAQHVELFEYAGGLTPEIITQPVRTTQEQESDSKAVSQAAKSMETAASTSNVEQKQLRFYSLAFAKNAFVVCCVGAFMGYAGSEAVKGGVMSVAWASAALAALEATKRSTAFKAITGPIAQLMDQIASARFRDVVNVMSTVLRMLSRLPASLFSFMLGKRKKSKVDKQGKKDDR